MFLLRRSGLYLRSEVESDNMYNNIDTALPKLEKQIIKNNKKYRNKFAEKATFDTFEFLEEAPKMETQKVVKTKTFDLDPISVEDAEAYMEAVGHSFYVFLNGETGEINIIYKIINSILNLSQYIIKSLIILLFIAFCFSI